MSHVEICVVDAFASEKFRGNPAAICFLEAPATDAWRQAVAAEMNLSETAFLEPHAEGWSLRWFTPSTEVALCGHATLASAHALWESGRAPALQPISFFTRRSGTLVCSQSGTEIRMDFPSCPAVQESAPEGLLEALGCDMRWVGRTEFDYLIEVANEAVVRSLKPDFRALAELPVRGFIVTAPSTAPFDFVSRFFAPAAGVPEDPVTGSAHCSLSPYWAARLGRTRLNGWQASARGGAVGVELNGNRVQLSGKAVTVWRGKLV